MQLKDRVFPGPAHGWYLGVLFRRGGRAVPAMVCDILPLEPFPFSRYRLNDKKVRLNNKLERFSDSY